MSCNYADGLSPYFNKGKCGLPEKFDDPVEFDEKIKKLVKLIKNAKHVVVHTGAGISTSAGIPDFRGPKGVWTLEQKGEKPNVNISFDDAVPTITHMGLLALKHNGLIHYVISQNIDGLHLRSGFPRDSLAELHGNMFIEQCSNCKRQFVRKSVVPTVGQKCLGGSCKAIKINNRPCRGKFYDNILDWDHELPFDDLSLAQWHSKKADLSICLGTTLQIVPSGNLPLLTKHNGGKLVICNLQPTKHDKSADLIINAYVDDIIVGVAKGLGCSIESYSPKTDPTKISEDSEETVPLEWTISVWQPINQIKSDESKSKKTLFKKIKLENNHTNNTDLMTNISVKEEVNQHDDNFVKLDYSVDSSSVDNADQLLHSNDTKVLNLVDDNVSVSDVIKQFHS